MSTFETLLNFASSLFNVLLIILTVLTGVILWGLVAHQLIMTGSGIVGYQPKGWGGLLTSSLALGAIAVFTLLFWR